MAGHSLSRAIPTAEANIYDLQSLAMSHASLDRASLVHNNGSPWDSEPTIKKKRKRADARQLEALNRMYARNTFPSTEDRGQLARDLDMSPRSVQIWLAHAFVYITCRI